MVGNVIHESDHARIIAGWPYNIYEPIRPQLTQEEEELLDTIINVLLKKTSIVYVSFKLLPKEFEEEFKETFREEVLLKIPPQAFSKLPEEDIREHIRELLDSYLAKFPVRNRSYVVDIILARVFGLGELEPLLRDDELEEVMVNGGGRPVFVFHRKFGMCKTDIVLSDEEIMKYIKRVATFVNKSVSERSPLLDAHLPTGDRFNAAIPPVTVKGPSITIRKFRRRPFTLIDIMSNGTIPEEVAAFLWLAVDGMGIAPRNILIAGGTGSGKTTTLNALIDFIPLDQRIITVEDTKELDIPLHENWIPMVTRPASKGAPGITMNDLLKNALRMRPDRIIVGEVRGEEAETLFIAMDVGHQGTMGTLHANSAREVLLRLTSEPMNVPKDLLPLVNLILIQHRIRTPQGTIRRLMEVAEVARMDEQVLLSHVYKWDPARKKLLRTDVPSHTIEEMAEIVGVDKKEIMQEIVNREKVLRWAKRHVKDRAEFIKLVNAYYSNPEGILDAITRP